MNINSNIHAHSRRCYIPMQNHCKLSCMYSYSMTPQTTTHLQCTLGSIHRLPSSLLFGSCFSVVRRSLIPGWEKISNILSFSRRKKPGLSASSPGIVKPSGMVRVRIVTDPALVVVVAVHVVVLHVVAVQVEASLPLKPIPVGEHKKRC